MAAASPEVITPRGLGIPQPARDTVYLLRRDHPQVELTWASQFPSRGPDKLKLRKLVRGGWLLPVSLMLKADYATETREFSYGATAKDTIFHGSISVNVPAQRLEYRKVVAAPNGSRLAFTASATHVPGERGMARVSPHFGVQLEFGGDTPGRALPRGVTGRSHAVVAAGSHLDVKQRFTVAPGLALELCGGLTLPTPTARYSADAGTLALGEGAFRLHVAEVNAVLRI